MQPGGLFEAADAVVPTMICDAAEAMMGTLKVSVVVKNDGAEAMPAGTLVHLEIDKDGAITPLIDLATSKDLLPGQIEILAVDIVLPPDPPELPYLLRVVADSDLKVNECIEDNNANETTCFVPQ